MSVHVEARKKRGAVIYRLWTTERDCYCGPAMSEQDFRLDLLYSRIADAIQEIDASIAHAAEHGTSVRSSSYWAKLTDPWRKEMLHDDFPPEESFEETPAEKKKRLKVRKTLEELIARYLAD